MRPQDLEFLRLERHVSALTRKEGQEAAVFTLHFPQIFAKEIDDLGFGQVQGIEKRRGAEQARGWYHCLVHLT